MLPEFIRCTGVFLHAFEYFSTCVWVSFYMRITLKLVKTKGKKSLLNKETKMLNNRRFKEGEKNKYPGRTYEAGNNININIY